MTNKINTTQNVQFTITRNNKPFVVTGDYESVAPIYESLDLPVARTDSRSKAIKQPEAVEQALANSKAIVASLKEKVRIETKLYLFDAWNKTNYRNDYKLAQKLERMKQLEKEIGLSYSK